MKHAKTVNESPTKSTLKSKVTKKSTSTPSKSHSTEAGSKRFTNDIDRLLFKHVLADYDTFTAFFPGLSKKAVSVIKQDEFGKLAGKAVKEIPEFAQMSEAKLVKRLKDRMARLKIIAKGFEYLTREKSHADGERESQIKKRDPTWKEGVLKLKEFIACQSREREEKIKQKYVIPAKNRPLESDEDSASEEICAANGLPESLVQESIDAAPFHMNMTQGTSTSSENSIPQIFPSNDYFTYTDAPTQFFPSLPAPALSVYSNSEVTHVVSNQVPYVAGSNTEFTGWGNPPLSNCVWPNSANPGIPCGQSLLFQNVPSTLHIPSDTVIAHKQGQDPPSTFVPSTYGITYEQALEPSSPLQVFSQQDQGTSSQSNPSILSFDFRLKDLVPFIKYCNPEERTIDLQTLAIFGEREFYDNNMIAYFLKNKLCQQIYPGYNKIVFRYSRNLHNLLTKFLCDLQESISDFDTSGEFFFCELDISATANETESAPTQSSHGKSLAKTKQVQNKKRKTTEKPKAQLIPSLIEEGCETLPIRLERNPYEEFGFGLPFSNKIGWIVKNSIAEEQLRVKDKIVAIDGVALSSNKDESDKQINGMKDIVDLQISRPIAKT
ncbi:hypothetical protein Ddc_19101 [Ditylenchus destructor]|nr:hypothetical protein Ddc_19101 [Ditylenchus destructor]